MIRIWRGLSKLRSLPRAGCLPCAFVLLAALNGSSAAQAVTQPAPPQRSGAAAIQGTVLDSAGKLVQGATVRLEPAGISDAAESVTDRGGAFAFRALAINTYTLRAEKSGQRSKAVIVAVSSTGEEKHVDLVLEDAHAVQAESSGPPAPAPQAMEFADKPAFTVAGVTDWTAAGGHGSDTALRTSEALARDTLNLKAAGQAQTSVGSAQGGAELAETENKLRAALVAAPVSFAANQELGIFYLNAQRYRESVSLLESAYQIDPANDDNEYDLALALKGAGNTSQASEHVTKLLAHRERANVHRLAGELDELTGDPLAAVHEFERAVRLDPNEQNYFEWGSELLLHRAVLQAEDVFQTGATEFPKSARILTALGTALFAAARYDEAAKRLCEASDLNPADPEPYLFMGRIEIATPTPLVCVKTKLARFVEQQPENSLANYFYAMAIWRGRAQPADQAAWQQAVALLNKAVAIDSKCADAYLELGILYSLQQESASAIDYYLKAVAAEPELAEAHYRLGVTYDRVGEKAKAKQEFQVHDQLKKQQAAEIERQRREVKQFLVAGQPTYPAAQ